MSVKKIISNIYDKILSEEAKLRLERTVFILAMAGFLIHLIVIALNHIGWIDAGDSMNGLQSPINAIYTPFSILLFYEVYCLIYYLPKSITIYIGKQFEIITLITIREIFAEMSSLRLSSDLQQMYSELEFLYSMVAILVLFSLVYLFYRQNQKAIRINNNTHGQFSRIPDKKKKYTNAKKILTLVVGLLFIVLAIINLFEWIVENHSLFYFLQNTRPATKEFFSSFFMVLILSDVLVLLFSFAITETFPKVIRNSGFVISTTLIKLSFSVSGPARHLLVIVAVLFGTLILILYNRYRTIEVPTE